MLPDRVSNPGPLTFMSGALPTALRGPATLHVSQLQRTSTNFYKRMSLCLNENYQYKIFINPEMLIRKKTSYNTNCICQITFPVIHV